jgi:hypothetical protein
MGGFVMICDMCDAFIATDGDWATPVMMITGDIDTASERYHICKMCGHRQIIKD